jgi:hypothetical protein
MQHAKRNLINLAFWSCLQLEGDILAEVELPPSRITRYEVPMHQELPSMVTLYPIPGSSIMDSVTILLLSDRFTDGAQQNSQNGVRR